VKLGRRVLPPAVFAVLVAAAGAATTCLTHDYKYDPSTACGKLSGGSAFQVKRCATDAEDLKKYMEGQFPGENLSPDQCKLEWLGGCASFGQLLPGVVVVPKKIACNNVVCDQSPFFSNCVDDADCKDIPDARGGLPASGYSWPLAGNHSDVKEAYRPCCEFYTDNCNGAKGPAIQNPGEDKKYTPAERAERHGLCYRKNSGKPCWTVKPKAS